MQIMTVAYIKLNNQDGNCRIRKQAKVNNRAIRYLSMSLMPGAILRIHRNKSFHQTVASFFYDICKNQSTEHEKSLLRNDMFRRI